MKILVVDDDPALRKLIELVGRRSGLTVDSARDGDEAWDMIQRNRYTLAVVDLMMPRMNGFELVEHIGGLQERPAVIVVTATPDNFLHRLDPDVVVTVIRKPFDVETLSAVLREIAAALDEQRASEANVVDFPERRVD
jgi:DNA-binding response OmpR family regulator